ncbi:MAG: hypothetical protein V3T08_07230 [Gemmatimonadota bacterium]
MTVARLAIALLSLSLAAAPSAFAQQKPEKREEPESEVSPQIWIDYNPSVMLNPKLNLTTEVRPVSLLSAVSGLSLSYDC